MHIAVLSDIHANLDGWNECLKDLAKVLQARRPGPPLPDALWLLGDLLGYGPHAAKCIAQVRAYLDKLGPERPARLLCGNHEQIYLGPSNPQGVEPPAILTRSRRDELQADGLHDWLLDAISLPAGQPCQDGSGAPPVPYRLRDDAQYDSCACTLVHGQLLDCDKYHWPGVQSRWCEKAKPEQVRRDLDALRARHGRAGSAPRCCVLFCGHSHVPFLWAQAEAGGAPTPLPWQSGEPLALLPGYAYLVNVGSVGVWREQRLSLCINDYWASYALLEVGQAGPAVSLHVVRYPGCGLLVSDITTFGVSEERGWTEEELHLVLRHLYLE